MTAESPNTDAKPSFWGLRRAAQPSNLQAADDSGEGVGLYLSGNQAYLAAVRASRSRLPTVTSYQAVTLDHDPAAATAQVQEQLLSFGHGRVPRRLWTSLQSPGMVLQSLTIPRVRAAAMASAAFWTLKKERNLHTEETVFDIEQLRTVEEDGSPRLELLAVAVPKGELEDHQQFNVELGTKAAGVTPPVFAFRNYLRLAHPELNHGPCAVLFVNDASSDIFVFDGGQIVAVRTLRTGLDSLRDAFAQTLDLEASDPRVMACLQILSGEPPNEALFGGDAIPDAEEVFGWGRPVARRLARNIQRTLHAFEQTLESGSGAAPVFLIAGTITRYDRLVRFLGDQIGLTLTPLVPAKSEFLTLSLPQPPQEPVPEESGLSIAIGLALAEAYQTPNLLFTYEDRRRQRKRSAIARAARVSLVVLLVVLTSLTASLRYYLRTREKQRDRLRETVAIGHPEFDKKDIMAKSSQIIARMETTKALARAYYAPAVVAEIARLTPDNVFLLDVQVDLSRPATTSAPPTAKTRAEQAMAKAPPTAAKPKGGPVGTVRISGIIQAQDGRMDPILAKYMFSLEQSIFFLAPQMVERKLQDVSPSYIVFGNRDVQQLLFFTLSAGLLDHEPPVGGGGGSQ